MTTVLRSQSLTVKPCDRTRSDLVTVFAQDSLNDLARIFSESWAKFALVTDSTGRVQGIISRDQLIGVISRARGDCRWRIRSVQSLLVYPSKPHEESADRNAAEGRQRRETAVFEWPEAWTAVFEEGDLFSIIMEHDVMVSWRRLAPVLSATATDSVTLLPTRSSFDVRFESEWQRAVRNRAAIGLVLIDVDHFKEVNDTHGHQYGDHVLRAVASCCQTQLRSYDVLGRFGGDEFAAVICDCTTEEFEAPIRRLKTSVARLALTASDNNSAVSLSIGAAIVDLARRDAKLQELIMAADTCLYEAKRMGRDRIELTDLSCANVSE